MTHPHAVKLEEIETRLNVIMPTLEDQAASLPITRPVPQVYKDIRFLLDIARQAITADERDATAKDAIEFVLSRRKHINIADPDYDRAELFLREYAVALQGKPITRKECHD